MLVVLVQYEKVRALSVYYSCYLPLKNKQGLFGNERLFCKIEIARIGLILLWKM